jgi:hypothetical protein
VVATSVTPTRNGAERFAGDPAPAEAAHTDAMRTTSRTPETRDTSISISERG